MTADLHLHSVFSDGSMTPEELVTTAHQKGINTIALTDHDVVAGLERALQAGRKWQVEVIPGIEFSTYSGKGEIHVLGYGIDYENQVLQQEIDTIFQSRQKRAHKMIELLQKQGIDISFQEVQARSGTNFIGRPHIARTMVEKDYITEMGEAFTEKYIGNGGQAYVSRYKMTPEKAIKLLKEAGGLSVLAHPGFINQGSPLKETEIASLKAYGLEGVEVFHSKHNKEETDYYEQLALDHELLITGGSDFHGDNSPEIELGDIKLKGKYLQQFKQNI